MARAPIDRRSTPLRAAEWASVLGIGALVVGAVSLGLSTCSSSTDAEKTVEQLFVHLERGEHDDAFALLGPRLQEEMGTAKALGDRWRATRLTRVHVSTGCSGHVPGVTVRMHARTEGPADALTTPLELGSVGEGGTCKGLGPMPLVARLEDGKIHALRLRR